MPQIPRYDEAQVQTNVLPTPQMSGNSPGAQALGGLGHTLGGIGGQLQQQAEEQKQFADSSATMEARVSLNKGVLSLQTQALSRQGHAALDNKEMYDEFDKLYSDHANLMKNDTQRRLFAQQTAEDKNQFALSLERHAAEQGKTLGQNNALALVDTDMQKLSTLYRDPAAFGQQLLVTQAHALDALHMHGIADSDPVAAEKLAEIKSQAWVDNIRQTMVTNPAQAQHLFEVHQDEIFAHEREGLKSSITVKTDEYAGMAAADRVTPFILQGDKTETELVQMVRNDPTIKDNFEARKHAEAQVRFDYQTAKNSRAELVGDLGGKVEKAITAGIANGRPVSPRELAALPEYNALVQNGSKEALAEAHRFMADVNQEQDRIERKQHERKREAKSDAAESRRELKEQQQELTAALDDPDTLLTATVAQINQLAPRIGYAGVQRLKASRSRYLKDDTALEKAKVDKDILVDEMAGAGMKYVDGMAKAGTDDFNTTAKIKAKVDQQIRYEAAKLGKSVSMDRQREIIREQMLKVHVLKKGVLWDSHPEVPQFEAKPEDYEIPGASRQAIGTVVSVLRQRGIEPTYGMVQQGVKLLGIGGGTPAPEQSHGADPAAQHPQHPAPSAAPAVAPPSPKAPVSEIDAKNASESRRVAEAQVKESKRRAEYALGNPRRQYDAIHPSHYVTAEHPDGSTERTPKRNTYMDKDGVVRLK